MIAVGVPEITPVEVSRDKPAGNAGDIAQDTTAPPLAVGVTDVIAVPLASVNEFGLYVTREGAISFTVISKTVESLPPALVAVIV